MRCLALVSVAAALRGPARGGGRSAGRHRGRAAADASALALRSVGQNIEDHALECAVSEDVYYGGVRSSAGGASGRADAWRAYAFPGAGYPGGVDASPAVPFGANDLARVSEEPLFTADEARAVIDEAAAAQAWRSDALGADFATRSSCSYAAVLDLPKTLGWLNSRALPRLVEAMHSAYPEALKDSALRLKLSRLVKYDALNGATPELGMHRDGPLITATVALNGLDEYEGGGTVVEALSWDPSRPTADLATARSFERDAALRLARGHVLLYPGFIRHGGGAITSGVRYILVMFFVDKNVVDHDRHCIGRAKHLVDDALGIDGAAGRVAARRAAAAPEAREALLLGAVEECLEALERGADTKGEAAHAYLGLALLELGQVDAAVDALEDAVRLAPRSAHALATLARAYAVRGDGAAAVRAATAASAADVGSAAAHNNRGVLLADVGRHADAVEAFDTALAIRITAETLVNKAVSTASLGSLDDAKRMLDDALRIDAGHERARANLQVVVRRLALT